MNNAKPKATAKVWIESEVARQVRQHARASLKAEVCGVLIGKEEGSTTIVEACIAGASAAQGGAQVTFTQDTWEHIYRVKDEKYPDSRIVGWYHSHPGFGVFLSDHDLFIHENFFSSPQQIAWVYDPQNDEEGCFGWHEGEIRKIEGIALRFGQPCGEPIAVPNEVEEVVKGGPDANEHEGGLMPLLRLGLMCAFFFVVGGAASFFYISNRAYVLPREGPALIYVDKDRMGIVPPELAAQILTILQREYDVRMESGKKPQGSAAPAQTDRGSKTDEQWKQDGRQK